MIRFIPLLFILLSQPVLSDDAETNCVEESTTSFAEALLKSLDPESCQGIPVKVGQVKKFTRPRSWTGLSSSHALKRISNTHYQAILNLNFLDNGVAETPAAIRMREQVTQCIQIANSKIRGPGEEILEIKIIDPVSAKGMPQAEVPERLDINVLPPNRPSNMLNFSTMDCANITHEIFHMMGLVDEYDDSLRSTSGTQETCRIIPSRNTLMGLPSKFFEDAFGKTVECACSPSCQRFWSSTPPERRRFLANQNDPCAPLGGLKGKSYSESTLPDSESSLTGDRLTIVRKPRPDVRSLLTPNQFKKILSGYCDAGVGGYARCSSYSYFQSRLPSGQPNPQCADVPADCRNDDYYLGSP